MFCICDNCEIFRNLYNFNVGLVNIVNNTLTIINYQLPILFRIFVSNSVL